MKLLVDMNLSPAWVNVLQQAGWEAVHWSSVGDPRATDPHVTEWAREHGYVVLTHDLGFGTLLALTQAGKPSVLQIRTEDVTPAALQPTLLAALRQCRAELEQGALVVVEQARLRVRILPLQP